MLEDHNLSAVRYCLFSIFAATFQHVITAKLKQLCVCVCACARECIYHMLLGLSSSSCTKRLRRVSFSLIFKMKLVLPLLVLNWHKWGIFSNPMSSPLAKAGTAVLNTPSGTVFFPWLYVGVANRLHGLHNSKQLSPTKPPNRPPLADKFLSLHLGNVTELQRGRAAHAEDPWNYVTELSLAFSDRVSFQNSEVTGLMTLGITNNFVAVKLRLAGMEQSVECMSVLPPVLPTNRGSTSGKLAHIPPSLLNKW